MAEKLMGSITLELDDQELEAYLIYAEDPQGEEISPEMILNLMKVNGIQEGFDPDNVDNLIKNLKKEKKVLAAEGIPPKQPEPEEVEWKDVALPSDLEKDAEVILSMASPPEIYKTRMDKVKNEKLVEKKGGLPFFKAKQERVVYYEKTEVREKVYVDPTVLRTGYVTAGLVIADVYAAKPGEPGTSVKGRPIPGESPPGPSYWGGEGIKITKNSIEAETTGFLRIGKNWLDVIPYSPHSYEFGLSKDKATCWVSLTPGQEEAAFPSKQAILEALDKLEYPKDCLMPPEEIYQKIIQAIRNKEVLQEESVSVDRDAEIEVEISPDRVMAFLNLKKGIGKGQPLQMKAVGQEISKAKLKGMDLEKVKGDIMAFYRSTKLDLLRYPLAEGTPPERGESRILEFNAHFLEEKELRSIGSGQSDFPYDHLTKAAYVEKDQRVASLKSPTGSSHGKAGKDVFGQEIPGIPGNDPDINIVEGLRITGDDILASIEGIFLVAEKKEAYHLLVSPYKEGRVEVSISDDRMKAFVSIIPPQGGGTEVEKAQIEEALKSCKIVKGIHQERIDEAMDVYISGGEVKDYWVAQGEPPSGSLDSRIEYYIDSIRGLLVPGGSFKIPIKENETILKMKAVGEETPGIDIYGQEVPPVVGENFRLEIGKNLRRDNQEEGAFLLSAEKAGELIYNGDRIFVNDARYIDGTLSKSMGNVRFAGSVVVKGDVTSGVAVVAGGDIHIHQGVQTALLSADGSIVVKMGVRGGGKGVLRAKRHVGLGFVEHSTIMSVGNLNIRKSCLRSEIRCNGRVMMNKKDSSLVGGNTRSRKGLEVQHLGAESGVKTTISFGQDYLVENKIEAAEREIEKLKATVVKIDQIMKNLDKDRDKLKLDKIRSQKVDILKSMEKRTLNVFNLREKYEEHFDSDIIVWGHAYPGVIIESHGRELVLDKKLTSVRIYFDKNTGQIKHEPI